MDERLARRGFALITVLAVLAAIGGVALAATSLGRDEFNASMNRIALERAWWAAEGCAAQIQSVVADSLVAAGDEPGAQDAVWRALDRVIGTVRLSDTSCTFDAEATGSRLDVNTATEEELDRLFEALGLGGSPMHCATRSLIGSTPTAWRVRTARRWTGIARSYGRCPATGLWPTFAS